MLATSLLRCPLCRQPLEQRGRSLFCPKGHCHDIARQGYVNLAPKAKGNFYKKELFESRAKVFEAGVFAPVVEAISEALDAYVPGECPVILDAGCGEGYYLRSVCPDRQMTRIGFDIAKEAVQLAAKAAKEASFFVGDLAAIPVLDGCCNAVLDVFTPANYGEFARVLKPGGVLIKLAPRAGYLCQLRKAAGDQLRHQEYDGGQVERYAQQHMQMKEQRAITYTVPVDPDLAFHLARMTPMLAGVDLSAVDLSGVTEITIDETLYVGTMA